MSDDLDPTTEARLRAALASRAASVDAVIRDPGPPQGGAVAVPFVRRRPAALAALAVAAAVALVLGAVVAAGGGDGDAEDQRVAAGEGTSTTASAATVVAPEPSVAPPPTTAPPATAPDTTTVRGAGPGTTRPLGSTTTRATADGSIAGWPARGSTRFPSGRAASAAFVKEVLGFAKPTFRRSTTEAVPVGGTAQVTWSARPTAGAETTVIVVRNGERSWLVQGATSNQGTITRSTFSSGSITVSGSATAFEATLTLRALSLFGTRLGEAIAMGGANGEQGPYEGSVAYRGGTAAFILVGAADESGEGDLIWAAVAMDPALR